MQGVVPTDDRMKAARVIEIPNDDRKRIASTDAHAALGWLHATGIVTAKEIVGDLGSRGSWWKRFGGGSPGATRSVGERFRGGTRPGRPRNSPRRATLPRTSTTFFAMFNPGLHRRLRVAWREGEKCPTSTTGTGC